MSRTATCLEVTAMKKGHRSDSGKTHPAPIQQSHPNGATPPDGGAAAWLKVIGCSFVMFNTVGVQYSYGVFEAYYKTSLLPSYSIAQLSLIGTIQGFLLAFIGIAAGPAFDRGYHNTLLYSSSVLIILGFMTLSLSTKFYQVFLSQGICFGLGSGLVYSSSLALVASSFTKRRATALMVANTGSSVGAIVYSLVFQQLIKPLGFPWTVRIMGFIMLGTSLVAVICLHSRHTTSKKPRSILELRAFKEPPYVTFCIGGFLKYLGITIPATYAAIYAESVLGASQKDAFLLQIYLNLASIGGRLLASQVADNLSPMLAWTGAALATSAMCFSWLAVKSYNGMIVWAVLFGFFSSPLYSLPITVLPYISPIQVIGTRMGMTSAIAGVGFFIGSPIAGALTNLATADFRGSILFCGCVTLAGSLAQLPQWWMIRWKLAQNGKASGRFERWVLGGKATSQSQAARSGAPASQRESRPDSGSDEQAAQKRVIASYGAEKDCWDDASSGKGGPVPYVLPGLDSHA